MTASVSENRIFVGVFYDHVHHISSVPFGAQIGFDALAHCVDKSSGNIDDSERVLVSQYYDFNYQRQSDVGKWCNKQNLAFPR